MPPKKKRQRTQLLITAGVMGFLLLGALVVILTLPNGEGAKQAPAEPPPVVATPPDKPTQPTEPPPEEQATGPTLVEDNGRTLWAPPTAGAPLPLGWLPPGVQMVLSVRLADTLATADGRIVAEQFAERLKPLSDDLQKAGIRLNEVKRLTVALRPGASYSQLDYTCVVQTTTEPSSPTAGEPRLAAAGKLGQVYEVTPDTYVLASSETIDELLDLQGDAPPLRRELEELAEHSDSDRHVSLLVAPSFLFAEGKPLFAGEVAALEEPLMLELPKQLRGLLVSCHWQDERFYWEVRAAAAVEMTAGQVAANLTGRLAKWPGELQLALLDLSPAPYGRQVVANLPAMTRVAAEYARRGVRDRHAVINGYLPPAAGHNLLLAAELMLAQQSTGVVGGPAMAAAGPPRPRSATDRLQRPATVSFGRDTLEMALQYLSDEIDVPIVILGGDLQLDGITKNQSFALDERNKPGESVLVEVLTRANPDKTAAGPDDPKQKLVYVVKQDDNGEETIFVTTRAAAAKRGDKLPSVFEP